MYTRPWYKPAMTNKTILVCGHGPGISDAVARKFGAEGFRVGLVARNAERLDAAAAKLREAGITAEPFACDLGDVAAMPKLIARAREKLGPITVLHWNAYAARAGDLATSDVSELRTVLDVGVSSLVAATQAALPDMKGQEGAAVLITGGGFGLYDASVDDMAVKFGAMGVALSKAAQHKLTGLLHRRLAGDGIYVGEVMVLGTVKGTAFDQGQATLEGKTVADRFWAIYQERSEPYAQVRG